MFANTIPGDAPGPPIHSLVISERNKNLLKRIATEGLGMLSLARTLLRPTTGK